MALATQKADTSLLIKAYISRANIARGSRSTSTSLNELDRALVLSYSIADTTEIIRSLLLIASTFKAGGVYLSALGTYRQVIELGYERLSYSQQAALYNNIANIYLDQRYYDNAREYYQKALQLSRDSARFVYNNTILNNLAELEYESGDYIAALCAYYQSLVTDDPMENALVESLHHAQVAKSYEALHHDQLALQHAQIAHDMAIKHGFSLALAEADCVIASVYKKGDHLQEARHVARNAINAFDHEYSPYDQYGLYLLLADIHEQLHQPKQALYYLDAYTRMTNSVNQNRPITDFASNEFNTRYIKRQQEHLRQRFFSENLQTQSQERPRHILLCLGAIFFVIISTIRILRSRSLQKQQANEQLLYRHEKLEDINSRLEAHNKDLALQQQEIDQNNLFLEQSEALLRENAQRITSSLDYVKNIQLSLLPNPQKIACDLGENFLIYKPRDTVTGDFYWYHSTPDQDIVAVVDCAGHGIPGALMSLIGNILLNKIIKEWNITDPAEILTHLNEQIHRYLSSPSATYYGHYSMDLSLIAINAERTQLTFAGAASTIFIYQNQQIKRIRGNIISTGTTLEGFSFTNQTLDLQPPTLLYLTSDGFIDQLDPNHRKFGVQRLMRVLSDKAMLPLAQQKEILLQALSDHQRNTEQTDDICLLGLKLSTP